MGMVDWVALFTLGSIGVGLFGLWWISRDIRRQRERRRIVRPYLGDLPPETDAERRRRESWDDQRGL